MNFFLQLFHHVVSLFQGLLFGIFFILIAKSRLFLLFLPFFNPVIESNPQINQIDSHKTKGFKVSIYEPFDPTIVILIVSE